MYEHILVAMDGSEPSRYAGQAARALAVATGARITACHVYAAEIHRCRFIEMEPGLPEKYQEGNTLTDLRSAHNRLMGEGFQALSAGYVEGFAASCQDAGVDVESIATEGRSYVGILNLIRTHQCDLIVLGADGLGAVGNDMLGGTTTRILQSAPCDVLVTRRPPNAGPVLTGVDGSEEALKAVDKAVAIAGAMKRDVRLTAVYDPDFHTHVFDTMAKSLSPEGKEKINLTGQEKLHDEIINDGLGKLYTDFLSKAKSRFNGNGAAIETSLATGKPYCGLDSQAVELDADLIVISRHGHHRMSCSRLGSNAEGLLRTTSANVLLVGGVGDTPPAGSKATSNAAESKSASPAPALRWDPDAESRLLRVPSFVRPIARRAVEAAVRKAGNDRVTADDFDAIAAKIGMGPKGKNV